MAISVLYSTNQDQSVGSDVDVYFLQQVRRIDFLSW